jgi:hypothetical protein
MNRPNHGSLYVQMVAVSFVKVITALLGDDWNLQQSSGCGTWDLYLCRTLARTYGPARFGAD